MSAFDDLTFADVDRITDALDVASIADADPMELAAAVMWITAEPDTDFAQYRARLTMGAVREFSVTEMTDPDPTVAPATVPPPN